MGSEDIIMSTPPTNGPPMSLLNLDLRPSGSAIDNISARVFGLKSYYFQRLRLEPVHKLESKFMLPRH